MTGHSADERVRFVGVAFDAIDLDTALARIANYAQSDRFAFVVTPNSYHAAMLDGAGSGWPEAARRAIANADLCLNDSRVIERLARRAGIALSAVPGSDLTRELICRDVAPEADVLLVGGAEADFAWLKSALPKRKVDHFVPPMGVRDRPELRIAIAERVETAACPLVFLAIGAPQSEMVAQLIAERGRARGVALCIGASIEFLSGRKRRAPEILQKARLEWLFRLLSEPRRMARRYLVESPRVLAIALRKPRN